MNKLMDLLDTITSAREDYRIGNAAQNILRRASESLSKDQDMLATDRRIAEMMLKSIYARIQVSMNVASLELNAAVDAVAAIERGNS